MTTAQYVELVEDALKVIRVCKEADVFRDHAYDPGDDDVSIVDLVNDLKRRLEAALER